MKLFSAPFLKTSVSTYPLWKRSIFKTMPLQKPTFLKPFSKASIFISVISYSSIVDNRRKRIKKYAFSYKNALVWSEPQTATICRQTLNKVYATPNPCGHVTLLSLPTLQIVKKCDIKYTTNCNFHLGHGRISCLTIDL